jgi:RHS repeat-associated protein
VGNRLTRSDSGGTVHYEFDANDRLISQGSLVYSYDDNGNLLSSVDGPESRLYTYDSENRLATAQIPGHLIQHDYDAGGVRIKSTVDGIVTDYLVDVNRPYSQVMEERDGTGTLTARYIFGDQLISQERNGQIGYSLYDGHGSIRGLTSSSQSVTDTYTYDAFGTLLHQTGVSNNPYRYAGEEYDPQTGLYHLRARDYDPFTGRFRTPDPFPGNIFDPPSLHAYTYAHNNPVNFTDPSGKTIFSAGGLTLIGVMIVVAIISLLVLNVEIKPPRSKGLGWRDYTEKIFLRGQVVDELNNVPAAAVAEFLDIAREYYRIVRDPKNEGAYCTTIGPLIRDQVNQNIKPSYFTLDAPIVGGHQFAVVKYNGKEMFVLDPIGITKGGQHNVDIDRTFIWTWAEYEQYIIPTIQTR